MQPSFLAWLFSSGQAWLPGGWLTWPEARGGFWLVAVAGLFYCLCEAYLVSRLTGLQYSLMQRYIAYFY